MNIIRRIFGKSIKLGQRFVILGMDGIDPQLIRKGIDEGYLPNFAKLAEMGAFTELQTTWMPLSPVAWSSFVSGCQPGRHGIYDFLHRDPDNYEPYLSIAQQKQPEQTLDVGPYQFPLTSGHTEKGRKGPAFWTESSREGIKTNVIRCPVSFPPEPVRGKMLSGLGVPDLKGTQGDFTFYTSAEDVNTNSRGGTVVRLKDHPHRQSQDVLLEGPPNPLLKESDPTTVPLTLDVDDSILELQLQGERYTLEEQDWTDWITVDFDFLGPIGTEGQVRFYLHSVDPVFELYCSPVNVSSSNPAFPISYPESYAEKLSGNIGHFHTLGLTADTGMLKEGRVDNVAFLEQTQTVLDERIRMLKEELSQFDDGIFNLVFDIPDRIQHMFWRYLDPDHSLNDEDEAEFFGDVIRKNYQKMDEILGWVLDELRSQDDLIVCSDHGFRSFRREVDLNRWLVEEGFMTLQDGTSPEDTGMLFRGVDWSQTQAYALGLSGLFINLDGREEHGSVPKGNYDEVLREVSDRLTSLTDPAEGRNVVSRVKKTRDFHKGGQYQGAPDLLVGYNEGYRVSWNSAIGGMEENIFTDNENPWSGDHCLDPQLIPGSLLTNFPINTDEKIGLWDVMPGVFDRLEVDVLNKFDGSAHWV